LNKAGYKPYRFVGFDNNTDNTATNWNQQYNPNYDSKITVAMIDEFLLEFPNCSLSSENCVTIDGEVYLLVGNEKYSLGFSNYYSHSNTIDPINPLSAYETSRKLTPAAIIYYVCVENDMNVVWVLANLQKEQSLIEQHLSSYQVRLNRAIGYMYFDSSSGRRHYNEGEKFCGFIGQVVGGSYQFKKYCDKGMNMEQAYNTYTPSTEAGNMKYGEFMKNIYEPYCEWFEQHIN